MAVPMNALPHHMPHAMAMHMGPSAAAIPDMTGSRLESIKKSIIKQVNSIKKEHPNWKIGFITFSTGVTLYGDCNSGVKPIFMNGDNLNNY